MPCLVQLPPAAHRELHLYRYDTFQFARVQAVAGFCTDRNPTNANSNYHRPVKRGQAVMQCIVSQNVKKWNVSFNVNIHFRNTVVQNEHRRLKHRDKNGQGQC